MTGLPVLVAPDGFKGTFTADEAAAAIARGVRAGGLEALELPVADGGEGTGAVLARAAGGRRVPMAARDALGRVVEAEFWLLDDGRAVVEVAAASGLERISEQERDAWSADSHGTGELIAAAAAVRPREILVAAGGSATTDGGRGCVEALDRAGVHDLPMTVICDVHTPFEDAARVFSPQKGADPGTVRRLSRRLRDQAARMPRDPRGVPMTGAAGGLAGGLWAHRGARLAAGAAFVLDAVGFDEAMRSARFVVTGEGRLDSQTLRGKAVGEIATRARQGGVTCHAVVGENAMKPFEARIIDLETVTEARTNAALEAAGRDLAVGSLDATR